MFALRRSAKWLCVVLLAACNDPEPNATTPHGSSTGATPTPALTTPAPAASGKGATPTPDGAALYQKYCALCHGKEGTGYAADNAPSLVSKTFLESASNHFIAQGIREGRPGTAMAAYDKRHGGPLERADVNAIVSFLRSKGPPLQRMKSVTPSGDAERGAELFKEQCTTCHGTKEQRGKAPWLHIPEFLSAATPTFLHYAIVNGRPPTEMPAFGTRLSETQIDDLVTYLYSNRPGYRRPVTDVDVEALKKLPVVMNPGGAPPTFSVRENRYVGVDQVKKAFDAKNRMIIIDARAASDFIRSHIPGSISNPYYDTAGLDRVPKDGTWVIAYCACPHHASGEVVDELRRRGHKNAAILDEGVLEWEKRGYPVVPFTPPGAK